MKDCGEDINSRYNKLEYIIGSQSLKYANLSTTKIQGENPLLTNEIFFDILIDCNKLLKIDEYGRLRIDEVGIVNWEAKRELDIILGKLLIYIVAETKKEPSFTFPYGIAMEPYYIRVLTVLDKIVGEFHPNIHKRCREFIPHLEKAIKQKEKEINEIKTIENVTINRIYKFILNNYENDEHVNYLIERECRDNISQARNLFTQIIDERNCRINQLESTINSSKYEEKMKRADLILCNPQAKIFYNLHIYLLPEIPLTELKYSLELFINIQKQMNNSRKYPRINIIYEALESKEGFPKGWINEDIEINNVPLDIINKLFDEIDILMEEKEMECNLLATDFEPRFELDEKTIKHLGSEANKLKDRDVYQPEINFDLCQNPFIWPASTPYISTVDHSEEDVHAEEKFKVNIETQPIRVSHIEKRVQIPMISCDEDPKYIHHITTTEESLSDLCDIGPDLGERKKKLEVLIRIKGWVNSITEIYDSSVLSKTLVRFGRAPNCHLQIKDPGMSPQQGAIFFSHYFQLICDQPTQNIYYKIPYNQKVRLYKDDIIMVHGNHIFKIKNLSVDKKGLLLPYKFMYPKYFIPHLMEMERSLMVTLQIEGISDKVSNFKQLLRRDINHIKHCFGRASLLNDSDAEDGIISNEQFTISYLDQFGWYIADGTGEHISRNGTYLAVNSAPKPPHSHIPSSQFQLQGDMEFTIGNTTIKTKEIIEQDKKREENI